MKILFADAIPEVIVDSFRDKGDECVLNPDLTAQELPAAISGFDVLVVRSTPVNSDVIDRSDCLGLIVRSGAGTNTIDCAAAADAGIYVCNVPGTNSIAVAELAIGLIVAIDRRIAESTFDLRRGAWNKKTYSSAEGLYGRTLGIVGVGEVGLALAERSRAFGMRILAQRKVGRRPEVETRIRSIGIRLVDDLSELLAVSDIVSIHLPATPENIGLVGDNFLGQMKENAVLINTSRGELIDEEALLRAMESKGIRAGLDVFIDEPKSSVGDFHSDLASHPNVIGTHHIGASTQQAQDATSVGTVQVIEAYRHGNPINCVNMGKGRVGSTTITLRHYDRVGVLAAVFEVLKEAEVNAETMQNKVFDGSNAAVAVIDVSGEITDEVISQLSGLENVIQVQVSQREQ